MKVLHVSPCFAPAWAYGDVARAVTELARAQVALGHQVVVLTTDALAPHERLAVGEAWVDGVRVIRSRNVSSATRTWLNLSTPLGMRRRARDRFDEGVDLVHGHELRTVENLLVASVAPAGTPFVVSTHGTLGRDTARGWARRIWDGRLGDRLLRRIDQVVVLSPEEADAARELWAARQCPLRDDQVAIVPDGVDLSAFASLPNRDAARRRFGLGSGFVVLFLGRLSERAELHLLIPAFASIAATHPDAHLVIAGPDHGAGAAARAEVASRHLEDRVHFTGFLTGDAKLAALAAADLFVRPGAEDGCSLAVLEAMACHLPVLVSPDCRVPEVATHRAGQVVPPDVDLWSSALETIVAQPALRASMRKHAGAVAADHTWPAAARRVDAIYRPLLAH